MITMLIHRLWSDVKVLSNTKTWSKKLYCSFWEILAMYFDLLGKATPVHSLAGMCCLCSGTACVVKLSCCSRAAVVAAWYQGSWWCFILRSGVPQLWCSWGGGSASRPRGKCCKRRCCSVSTWLECPEIIACRGGASLCSLLPARKPLVLVAEKLCHIKIPSVLLACRSVKNKILNSASRWIP